VNLIRSLMTVFLLCVVALCVTGWIWAGGQPSPKSEGARVAVGLSGLMAAGSIVLLWKEKQRPRGSE
jgi:hypothetical protein